jgi:hypothetical protein
MMNTLDLIENDFKQLQGEMKKKYTNIKDVRKHTHSHDVAGGQGSQSHLELQRDA